MVDAEGGPSLFCTRNAVGNDKVSGYESVSMKWYSLGSPKAKGDLSESLRNGESEK